MFLDIVVVLCAKKTRSSITGVKYTRLGRPYLSGVKGFSMSSSRGVQSYLYANRKYVGIDIEHVDRPDLQLRRRRMESWLSQRDHVQVDFLSGWVAREACAKSMGLGLLHVLHKLSIIRVHPVPCTSAEYILIVYNGLHFITYCARVDNIVIGICYRQEYPSPRIILLHSAF